MGGKGTVRGRGGSGGCAPLRRSRAAAISKDNRKESLAAIKAGAHGHTP
jgi:hypothetical protein